MAFSYKGLSTIYLFLPYKDGPWQRRGERHEKLTVNGGGLRWVGGEAIDAVRGSHDRALNKRCQWIDTRLHRRQTITVFSHHRSPSIIVIISSSSSNSVATLCYVRQNGNVREWTVFHKTKWNRYLISTTMNSNCTKHYHSLLRHKAAHTVKEAI